MILNEMKTLISQIITRGDTSQYSLVIAIENLPLKDLKNLIICLAAFRIDLEEVIIQKLTKKFSSYQEFKNVTYSIFKETHYDYQ